MEINVLQAVRPLSEHMFSMIEQALSRSVQQTEVIHCAFVFTHLLY